MLIKKKSKLSGKENILSLDVTIEQMKELEKPNRRNIQDIFPNLLPEEREFLMTGITPEEWNSIFN